MVMSLGIENGSIPDLSPQEKEAKRHEAREELNRIGVKFMGAVWARLEDASARPADERSITFTDEEILDLTKSTSLEEARDVVTAIGMSLDQAADLEKRRAAAARELVIGAHESNPTEAF